MDFWINFSSYIFPFLLLSTIFAFFYTSPSLELQFSSFDGYLLTTNIEKCKFPLRCVSVRLYVNDCAFGGCGSINIVQQAIVTREFCFAAALALACTPKQLKPRETKKTTVQRNVQIAEATITLTIWSIHSAIEDLEPCLTDGINWWVKRPMKKRAQKICESEKKRKKNFDETLEFANKMGWKNWRRVHKHRPEQTGKKKQRNGATEENRDDLKSRLRKYCRNFGRSNFCYVYRRLHINRCQWWRRRMGACLLIELRILWLTIGIIFVYWLLENTLTAL